MTAKFQFSSEEDEKLIENVANYSFLYNICDENYKNHELKENVWKEISYELKRTGKYSIIIFLLKINTVSTKYR